MSTVQAVMPGSVLRHRPEGEHLEVGPIELFFDLVYVLTIIQLSHHLLEHLTWRGALETAVLFLAVWWAWNYSAWAMNWLDPDSTTVRLLLVALMVGAFGMAVALPHAFDTSAGLFVGGYLLMQLLRSGFMVAAFRGRDATMARNYAHLLVWSLLSAVPWMAGALATGNNRLGWWLLAVAIDYAAPWTGFFVPGRGATPMPSWSLRPGHLAERNRLVVIIALGETVLISGTLLTDVDLDAATVTAALLGFALLVTLWWNYFNPFVEPADTGDAAAAGRSSFAYAHAAMVAGAIVVAVGIEVVTAHPSEPLKAPYAVVLFAGPIIYLVGNAWYLRNHLERPPTDRLVAGVALAVLGPVCFAMRASLSPLLVIGAVTAVMGALAAVSTRGSTVEA